MSPELNDPDDVQDLLGNPEVPPARGRAGSGEVWVSEGATKLVCLVCGQDRFTRREILLNTTGMTFMDLDWLNRAGDGAICRSCGYLHTFAGVALDWR